MSWKATAWAKDTQGHRSVGEKLVLMMLAQYYNDQYNAAWPSQTLLASKCGLSLRQVQRCLKRLQDAGFITRIRKGNQHQPSVYRLHFHVSEPVIDVVSTPEVNTTFEASEHDIEKVNTTFATSEHDICVGTKPKERISKEPIKKRSRTREEKNSSSFFSERGPPNYPRNLAKPTVGGGDGISGGNTDPYREEEERGRRHREGIRRRRAGGGT